MFLHPFCHGLTSHGAVACESHRKYQTPQISSDGAFGLVCQVEIFWFFSFFLKEGGITGSVIESSCKGYKQGLIQNICKTLLRCAKLY